MEPKPAKTSWCALARGARSAVVLYPKDEAGVCRTIQFSRTDLEASVRVHAE